jgi:hypothetical protein
LAGCWCKHGQLAQFSVCIVLRKKKTKDVMMNYFEKSLFGFSVYAVSSLLYTMFLLSQHISRTNQQKSTDSNKIISSFNATRNAVAGSSVSPQATAAYKE